MFLTQSAMNVIAGENKIYQTTSKMSHLLLMAYLFEKGWWVRGWAKFKEPGRQKTVKTDFLSVDKASKENWL